MNQYLDISRIFDLPNTAPPSLGLDPKLNVFEAAAQIANQGNAQEPVAPVADDQSLQLKALQDAFAQMFAANQARQKAMQSVPVPQKRLSPMRPGETGLVALAGLIGRALGVDKKTLGGLAQGYVGTRQAQSDAEYERQVLDAQRQAQAAQNAGFEQDLAAQMGLKMSDIYGQRAEDERKFAGQERLQRTQDEGAWKRLVFSTDAQERESALSRMSSKEIAKMQMDYGMLERMAPGPARDALAARMALPVGYETNDDVRLGLEKARMVRDAEEHGYRLKALQEDIRAKTLANDIAVKYGMTEAELDIAFKKAQIGLMGASRSGGGGGRQTSVGQASPEIQVAQGLMAMPDSMLKSIFDRKLGELRVIKGAAGPGSLPKELTMRNVQLATDIFAIQEELKRRNSLILHPSGNMIGLTDLNGDGVVDIRDFSIYAQRRPRQPVAPTRSKPPYITGSTNNKYP